MSKKVVLSFSVSQNTRKLLRQIALEEDRPMYQLLEEMIKMRWQQISKKDATQ